MTYCEVVLIGDYWVVRTPKRHDPILSTGGVEIRRFSDWRIADAYASELNTAFQMGMREGRSE